MKPFLFLLLSACAWAQIEHPSIGVMLDENGHARPVIGAPAAAALGEPLFDRVVVSLACSDQVCLAKTESALVSSSGDTVEAPPGAAIIGFDPALDGAAAYVYFVETRQLARWSAGRLDPVDFAPGGDVLSLRATADGFEYAVARDDGIWIGNQNLGPANAILLLDGGGALLAADGHVRLLRPDGTELDFAVARVEGFIGGFLRMSDRSVQVITDSGMWMLDIELGREQLLLLPGVSQ
jgi:hypothetical protein